jgi:hypothetical protein
MQSCFFATTLEPYYLRVKMIEVENRAPRLRVALDFKAGRRKTAAVIMRTVWWAWEGRESNACSHASSQLHLSGTTCESR